MTASLSPPPTFNTLDPFQRARLIRSTQKVGRVLGSTPILLDAPTPRETRSLDLNTSQRLPIRPQTSSSGCGGFSSTNKGTADRLKARETRRHGSLFTIPISLNPAASESSSSLSSISSMNSVASVNSLREAKGFSGARHRKADIPTPLVLQVTSTPRVGAMDTSLYSFTSLAESQLTHRRSRSTSISLSCGSNSSASGSTPLTPSFRFRAAAEPAHRRQKLQKLARTLGENIPPALVFQSHPHIDLSAPATPIAKLSDSVLESSSGTTSAALRRSSTSIFRASRRRSSSVSTLHALDTNIRSSTVISGSDPIGASCWEPPAEWAMDPSEVMGEKSNREDQVMGMWNADDYDSVMDRLRQLKN